MENGATATYSGIGISVATPVWTLVHEPTRAQLGETIEVAASKLHGGIGFRANFNGGRAYPNKYKSGWAWWVKIDRLASWMDHHTFRIEASGFDPDEGRRIDPDAKDFTARPGRWERNLMQVQGERALRKFVDGLDGSNRERAAAVTYITDVAAAVGVGDLPAAILLALTTGLSDYHSDRLVGLLEDEMIYWPDFQRKGSTSADRTIAHHVPAGETNSGTSLTISGSGTNSGTLGSVSIIGGATG